MWTVRSLRSSWPPSAPTSVPSAGPGAVRGNRSTGRLVGRRATRKGHPHSRELSTATPSVYARRDRWRPYSSVLAVWSHIREAGVVLYLILRLWFGLAFRVYAVFRVWMPTNRFVRWLSTGRGIKWGLPIGVALTVLYYLAMTWGGGHLTRGSPWWWVPTLWAALNAIKFAYVAVRSPFVWANGAVRRRISR